MAGQPRFSRGQSNEQQEPTCGPFLMSDTDLTESSRASAGRRGKGRGGSYAERRKLAGRDNEEALRDFATGYGFSDAALRKSLRSGAERENLGADGADAEKESAPGPMSAMRSEFRSMLFRTISGFGSDGPTAAQMMPSVGSGGSPSGSTGRIPCRGLGVRG